MADRGVIERVPEAELLLEIGLVVFGVLVLVGLGAFVAGRATNRVKHTQRRAEGPPEAGSVPSSRHQNVGAVSAR